MSLPQVPLLDTAANITSQAAAATWTHQLSSPPSFLMPFLSIASFVSTLVFSLLSSAPAAKGTTIPLPSYPLAVKHPYLSTWIPGSQLKDSASARPQFWNGQNLTWPILARIDGTTYALFGVPQPLDNVLNAVTDSVSYTSTHTLVDLHAGDAEITLDFFSPVLPASEDFARQSLPYSYLTVSASNSDGHESSVQILSGIDQTWTNQNGAARLNHVKTKSSQYFQFHNPNEILFTETNEAMATYGTVVWSTDSIEGTSHAQGTAADIISGFAKNGVLTGNENGNSRDLAAFSKDLGKVSGKDKKSVTFAIGFDRADAINYLGDTQTGFYRSRWPTISEAVDFFLQDYGNANSASGRFDKEVRERSEAVSKAFGPQYADIIEASVRQTFGALELTVPKDNLSASPSIFLKEISSNGNLNTVDVMFQSWPVFVSLNPDYIKLFLQPMLSYLELPPSQSWPKPWVIHDLGTSYPNATGHNDGQAEQMPLFETSSLFILLLAYQKYSGDTAYAQQHRPLLEGYAEYLVHNSLYPSSQLISVDAIPATANQTGLAIQSAIGLKAASVILDNTTLAEKATSFAKTLYEEGLGLDGADPAHSSHFTYNYGKEETWNVLFPAFSDVLLGLETFPSEAWELQSRWYESQIRELGLAFAGPSTHPGYTGSPLVWGLVDWNIVAAGASSSSVQEAIINTTHAYLTNGLHNVPFGTKYNVEGPEVASTETPLDTMRSTINILSQALLLCSFASSSFGFPNIGTLRSDVNFFSRRDNATAVAACGKDAAPGNETCPLNVCCSEYGNCGMTADFCGKGCQSGCDEVQRPACEAGAASTNRTVGYYESWAVNRKCQSVSPEELNVTGFTHINYGFLLFDPNTFAIASADNNGSSLITRFTDLKSKNPGLQTWVAIGGWNFNIPGPTATAFSDMVGSPENRTKFSKEIISFMDAFAFDGLDIDWEYPSAPDRGGRPADKANLVALTKDLRQAFGTKYGLSVTLPASYYYMRNFDVAGMQEHVDFFNIMTYDLHGVWDKETEGIGPYLRPHTNLTEIDEGLDLLWRAKVASEKVNMGMAWYGRAFTLQDAKCAVPDGVCQFEDAALPGPCSDAAGTLNLFEIQDIIATGSLTPTLDKTAGVKYLAYNQTQWVGYDDDETIGLKRNLASSRCLGGTMVWAMDQANQKSACGLPAAVRPPPRENSTGTGNPASYSLAPAPLAPSPGGADTASASSAATQTAPVGSSATDAVTASASSAATQTAPVGSSAADAVTSPLNTDSASPSVAPSPSGGASGGAPAKTQPGIAPDCNSFATASAGDTFVGFAAAHGIEPAQLYTWNPVLGENGAACSTAFWAEESYCIGAGADGAGASSGAAAPSSGSVAGQSSSTTAAAAAGSSNMVPTQLLPTSTALSTDGGQTTSSASSASSPPATSITFSTSTSTYPLSSSSTTANGETGGQSAGAMTMTVSVTTTVTVSACAGTAGGSSGVSYDPSATSTAAVSTKSFVSILVSVKQIPSPNPALDPFSPPGRPATSGPKQRQRPCLAVRWWEVGGRGGLQKWDPRTVGILSRGILPSVYSLTCCLFRDQAHSSCPSLLLLTPRDAHAAQVNAAYLLAISAGTLVPVALRRILVAHWPAGAAALVTAAAEPRGNRHSMASGISGAGNLQDNVDYSIPHRPPPAPPSNASTASPNRSPDFAQQQFIGHQRQKSSGSGSVVKGRSRKNSLGQLLRGGSISRPAHQAHPSQAAAALDPLTAAPPLPPPPFPPPPLPQHQPTKPEHFHYGQAATVTSTAYSTPKPTQIPPHRPSVDDSETERKSHTFFRSRSRSRSKSREGNMLRRGSKARQQAELERQQREAQMLPKQPPQLPSHNPLPGMPSFGGENARPDSVAMFNQHHQAKRLPPQSAPAHAHAQPHTPATTANFSRPGTIATAAPLKDNSSSPTYALRGASASVSPPSAPVASANGEDAYERTGSMTNRGRYSYTPATAQTGHVNSPRRMRRRKDPTPFNILVVGTKNSGKSSFVSLLQHSLATSNSKRDIDGQPGQTKGTFTSSFLETEMEGERVGLTLWDSAGLEKNIVDLQLREMTAFIESKFEETFAEEQKVMRSPGFRDTHIHCVFLVLDPLRLDANIAGSSQGKGGAGAFGNSALDDDIDLQVLRALWEKTVVIPVIAKADTLTTKHMSHLKRTVWQNIKDNSMNPLDALDLEDDDEDASGGSDALLEEDEDEAHISLPIHHTDDRSPQTPIDNLLDSSSSESSTSSRSAKAKRASKRMSHILQPTQTGATSEEEPYLPLSVLSPDPYSLPTTGTATEEDLSRVFPWGSASPLNPQHCDFPRLRDSVFLEWRNDLRELSRTSWYEQWRTSRLRNIPGTKMRLPGGVTPVASVPREGRGDVRNFSGPVGVPRSVSSATQGTASGAASGAPVGMAVSTPATAH
ncbi:hypothetical protein Q7P37_006627 [Cladosporium fusiforme]